MSTEQQTPVATVEEVSKDQVEQQETVAAATEQVAPATEQTTPAETQVTKDEVTEAKVDGETAEPSDDKPAAVDVTDSKADEKASETVDEVKVVEPVAAEAESNGNNNHSGTTAENGKTQEAVEPAKEAEVETNGVCKRKAENGTEAADGDKTESSPKKVKVVNDGEQAPTEETAA